MRGNLHCRNLALALFTFSIVFVTCAADNVSKETRDIALTTAWKLGPLDDQGEMRGGGSAVTIRSADKVLCPPAGATVFLTAKHGHTLSAERPVGLQHGEQVYPGVWQSTAENEDLALIRIEAGPFPVVVVAEEEPEIGAEVLAACYGGETAPTPLLITGYVVGYWDKEEKRYPEESPRLMLTDLHGTSGVSGSGVLNASGELVGIQVARAERALEACVPLRAIKEFLDNESEAAP